MNILLDECLPRRLNRLFTGHEVKTARQMNWHGLGNGKLLAVADPHFDAFVTVDKNLIYQQKSDRTSPRRGRPSRPFQQD